MAIYTLAEVAKHKTSDAGVWIVINDKVYDVSKFLEEVASYKHFNILC